MRDNRKSDDKLEELMKSALASKMEPDEEVNRRILRNWKEKPDMKKQRRKSLQIAVAAAACVMLTGVTVGATVRYMNAAEAAEAMGDEGIAEAFRGENATTIDEAQEWGDYRVTLLGITTGEELTQTEVQGELAAGSTYAAVAIERKDQTPMPSTDEDAYNELSFFISPLVEGLTPWEYNIASMGGGYCDMVENGILYRIIECDNVMLFADRTIYLCVSDTDFYEKLAYNYNESTGSISRNEDYSGMNLLFTLPVDSSKADIAAAEEYLKALEESWYDGEEDTEQSAVSQTAAERADLILELLAQGNKEEAVSGAELLDTATLTLKNGRYEYSRTTEEEGVESSAVYYFYPDDFNDGLDAMIYYHFKEQGDVTSLLIMILQDNGDGTATIEVWESAL